MTLVVPEDCAEGLRQFARELRARQCGGPAAQTPEWRKISPSAELMVDPECGARCAIRDTRTPGADRFQWSATILGRSHPVAAGRTGNLAEARSLAELALRAYVADCRELSGGHGGDG